MKVGVLVHHDLTKTLASYIHGHGHSNSFNLKFLLSFPCAVIKFRHYCDWVHLVISLDFFSMIWHHTKFCLNYHSTSCTSVDHYRLIWLLLEVSAHVSRLTQTLVVLRHSTQLPSDIIISWSLIETRIQYGFPSLNFTAGPETYNYSRHLGHYGLTDKSHPFAYYMIFFLITMWLSSLEMRHHKLGSFFLLEEPSCIMMQTLNQSCEEVVLP